MKYAGSTYTLHFDGRNNQVNFSGVFRPVDEIEVSKLNKFLFKIHDAVKGDLRLDFRRLRYINAEGIKALSLFIEHAKSRKKIKIKLIASGVLAWSVRVLPDLCTIWDQVEFSIYDSNFYASQDIVEANEFIPLLLEQNRLLWPVEKEVIKQHGLTDGLRVADICCGCGDVPLLICQEFHPGYVLGVDHSEVAIKYARDFQLEINIRNIEFQRGDATALLVEDNSFDFVSCRLGLQVFSRPKEILKEMIRISRPGGRIYLTGEDYSYFTIRPEDAVCTETYQQSVRYGKMVGLDLQIGSKLKDLLVKSKLEHIRTDKIVVDTKNSDKTAFSRMVWRWQDFYANSIGSKLHLQRTDQDFLISGYQKHMQMIQDPQSYSAWTVIAVSGQKPFSKGKGAASQ